MAELFGNNCQTTLAAAITSTSATSITVASNGTPNTPGGFPATGNFRILIDSEYMLVTGVSGTTWTVTRGIEGSVAATHSSGVQVTQIVTAGGLAAIGGDGGGGGWSFVSSSTGSHATPAEAPQLFIDVNSNGGQYTQGFPTSPNVNDIVAVHDDGATSSTTGVYVNPVTLSGGSIDIQDPSTMTVTGTSVVFGFLVPSANIGGGSTVYYKYNGTAWKRIG